MPVRVERDRLGEIEVPEGALYGARTARSVATASFSGRTLAGAPAFVRALAEVKRAAAAANHAAGVLGAAERDAIAAACEALAGGELDAHLVADPFAGGGGVALNVNVNEVVAGVAGVAIDPKRHVNASQSTSDACRAAMRVALAREAMRLDASLAALEAACAAKAVALAGVTVIARTCLQDALPVRLGDGFGATASMLARRRRALEQARAPLLLVDLGGTVVGSGAGAPAAYRAAIVGELRAVTALPLTRDPDPFDAARNADVVVGLAASLGVLGGALLKVCKDLRLQASGPSGGLGELVLPATQEGSSFFADKVNPVVPESVMHACFLVLGCARVAEAALEHGELDLNVFEGAAGFATLEALGHLTRATPLLTRCVEGLHARAPRSPEYEAALARLGVETEP